MSLFSKIKENGKSKFVFELSFASVVSIFGTAILLLVWSFILGIIMGRGYDPEEGVPQLAQIMPKESTAPSTPPLLTGDSSTGNMEAGKAETGIMRAEDLQFRGSLRNPDERDSNTNLSAANQSAQQLNAQAKRVNPQMSPQQGATPQSQTQAQAQAMSQAQQKAAQEQARLLALQKLQQKAQQDAQEKNQQALKKSEKDSKQAAIQSALQQIEQKKIQKAAEDKKNKPQSTANVAQNASGAQRFNYVYQVAASRDPKQAEEMIKRLATVGVNGRLEKQASDDWIRVLVNFVGTPDETQNLRNAVEKIGITRIIMRDKK